MPFCFLPICDFFPPSKKKRKKSSLVQVTYEKVDIEKERGRKSKIVLKIPNSSPTTHVPITSVPSITNLPNPLSVFKILTKPRVQRHKPSISGSKGKGFIAMTR